MQRNCFLMGNKPLSCSCSNPMHLLCAEKSRSVSQNSFWLKALSSLSLPLSLCLSDIRMCSRLSEHKLWLLPGQHGWQWTRSVIIHSLWHGMRSVIIHGLWHGTRSVIIHGLWHGTRSVIIHGLWHGTRSVIIHGLWHWTRSVIIHGLWHWMRSVIIHSLWHWTRSVIIYSVWHWMKSVIIHGLWHWMRSVIIHNLWCWMRSVMIHSLWHWMRSVIIHGLCQFLATLLDSRHSFACETNHISQLRIMSWKTTQRTLTCFSPCNCDDNSQSVPLTSSGQVDKTPSTWEGKETSQGSASTSERPRSNQTLSTWEGKETGQGSASTSERHWSNPHTHAYTHTHSHCTDQLGVKDNAAELKLSEKRNVLHLFLKEERAAECPMFQGRPFQTQELKREKARKPRVRQVKHRSLSMCASDEEGRELEASCVVVDIFVKTLHLLYASFKKHLRPLIIDVCVLVIRVVCAGGTASTLVFMCRCSTCRLGCSGQPEEVSPGDLSSFCHPAASPSTSVVWSCLICGRSHCQE